MCSETEHPKNVLRKHSSLHMQERTTQQGMTGKGQLLCRHQLINSRAYSDSVTVQLSVMGVLWTNNGTPAAPDRTILETLFCAEKRGKALFHVRYHVGGKIKELSSYLKM
ncbi:hypothetical protein AVEN_141953-1 [Araneus ventricosus]|uniref:Uncharacterized protein n=1 Tax=Araneus ventricosus TaxID=182803 RepID=A0A4Y2M900_ARAVE|nr:hypothetical protein AVEN_141953-1 [Araneus ventricosus]